MEFMYVAAWRRCQKKMSKCRPRQKKKAKESYCNNMMGN